MNLQKALEELNTLYQYYTDQEYVCHYRLERRLTTLLGKISSKETLENGEFQILKNKLENVIIQLEQSNQTMIKKLDFEEKCKELIKANDIANLNGLINIGEYFGTGPSGRDVCSALDNVYNFFRTTPRERKPSNMLCLDRLSEIIRQPKLVLPEINFNLFSDSRKKIQAILKADAINQLMVWLANTNQEDRNFALRCAASEDVCQHSLLFLLRHTSPTVEHAPINLLAAGQPSGQIALHRAILSEKTILVSLLLDERFNPSNDLLKQLLITDKNGLTPIHFIEKIMEKADIIDCSRVVDRIKEAMEKHQDNPRFGLSQEDIKTTNETLNRIKIKIDLALKNSIYGGIELKM